jgi:hypothetical protein
MSRLAGAIDGMIGVDTHRDTLGRGRHRHGRRAARPDLSGR